MRNTVRFATLLGVQHRFAQKRCWTNALLCPDNCAPLLCTVLLLLQTAAAYQMLL
jgi:hypothetical protein